MVTLNKKESEKFLKAMLKREKEPISQKDKALAQAIKLSMIDIMPKKKVYKVVYEYYIETDDDKKIVEFVKEIEKQTTIKGEVKIEMINVNEK